MKKKYCEDNIFVSPIEVRHFLLDIPVMKNSYQLNAVKFSLKSLYPGNEETTEIDYSCVNNKVIGIAANKEKINSLRNAKKNIISPTLITSRLLKEGIILSAGESWLELQLIRNGQPELIRTFSIMQLDSCIDEFNNLRIKEIGYQVKVICFDTMSDSFYQRINENGLIHEDIFDLISYSILRSTRIFTKKKNSKSIYSSILIATFCLLLLIPDYFLYKKAKEKKIILQQTKLKYKEEIQKEKNQLDITIKDDSLSVGERLSLSSVFSEIYRSSPEIRILSFDINDKQFRFEAERVNAMMVLEKLAVSEIFMDVVLHQSIPQEDGTERFVISGKVKDD